MTGYAAAARPTLYFIGVSTAQSSIMRIFPRWAEALGLAPGTTIAGIDFALHDTPARYRDAVSFIKHDPLSRGALVTTHKIDLFHACRDLFDRLDPFATAQAEVSCLSKRDGALVGHAKDPISARLALQAIVPEHWWRDTGGAVFAMGAGGATTAITADLVRPARGDDRPSRVLVSDISAERLETLRRFHREHGSDIPVDFVLATDARANDALLASLPPGSLVVNATGLGKDRPGSPLTGEARFPERGLVWELNYRGDLVFLDQAEQQRHARALAVTDGWNYFLHGWTQVIAEVFAVEIPPEGPLFTTLSDLAGGAPRAQP